MTTPKQDFPTIDPVANTVRRAKREQLLGDDPVCLLCGLANIDSLIAVSRGVLEAHHLVGRANDGDLTVPLCRNCHAEITEGYRDAGVPLNAPPTFLHKIAAILRAFGAFFLTIGQRFADWAEAVIRFVERLDRSVPTWRTWQEATA